ncbi:MAG: YHS domain protein [Bacteroidetes bacterium HGW-Bacteroidetes-4]|jgi:YHS domain-containing protein|nr:MAG: YHS domain protein [Bacteroidetes bacterium HGW-Bacteroidetes-4]
MKTELNSMMRLIKKTLVMLAFLILGIQVHAQKILVNTDDGIALSGYDAVAFFTEKKPVFGKASIKSVNKGAVYQFSSQENKQKFDKSPEAYLPQNGGFCTVSASMGKISKIEIETWSVVGNKLYLQKNMRAKGMWDKDPQNYIKKAAENWPGLVEKYGTPVAR